MASAKYLQAVSDWYADFFETIPENYWQDKKLGILDGAAIGVMTEKLLEEKLFRDTKAIALKIAIDKGVIFPATYIDSFLNRAKEAKR